MRRRQKTIKSDHSDVGWESVDWLQVAQGRHNSCSVVNRVIIYGLHKMRGIATS